MSNMFNYIRMVKMPPLTGLLALLLFHCFVPPCIGETGREMVVVFKGDKTEVPFEDKGKTIVRKPRAFRVPAFVGGVFNNKEFLAVFCDARYNGFSDWSFIEAASRLSYGNHSRWSNAEIFVKNTRKSPRHAVVGDITAVMKEEKIYVLAPSWDKSKTSWVQHSGKTGWNPFMIVGTVVSSMDSRGGGVSINWGVKRSLKSLLPRTINGGRGFQFIGGVGNGVVTKNGTIVFPIQLANKKRQVSSSIMYSTDGSNWKMGGTTPAGPSECSVVEWGEGKLLLTTRYDNGYRKIFESNNMGATWKESLMFSRLWGNQPNRRGAGCQGSVIAAPVDGEDVLLFSHPLNKRGGYVRDTLQLWLSDGRRVMCVGTISEDGKGERSGYSILAHVGENLYSMHEINPYGKWSRYHAELETWDRVIALSPLPHFYEIVKKTVRAWRELDKRLQKKGVPTNGLVGYLSNSNSGSVWADMYSCVDGTVKNGERVDGGFRFTAAPGSGAQWPVISQGQNQVYIFTKKQFTLTATVKIHATSGDEDVSLLGASRIAKGNAALLGLGYTKDKKWYVLHGYGDKTTTELSFDYEKEYYVAITFASGAASVFVDGVDIAKGKLTTFCTAWISHFFMGGVGQSSKTKGGSCTVRNVMLFNRHLSQEEVEGFSAVDEGNQHNEAKFIIYNNKKARSHSDAFFYDNEVQPTRRSCLIDKDAPSEDKTISGTATSVFFLLCIFFGSNIMFFCV